MNASALVERLRAYQAGRAIPVGTRRNAFVADPRRVLLLAFVRMGGESTPWAFGYGRPGGPRTFDCVPDPRKRDDVAAMVAELATPLFEKLEAATDEDPAAAHQVWVPGETHLEMIHNLAIRYTFAKRADPARLKKLNLLGRTANALFLESEFPGSTLVASAPRLLRELYAFPAEPVRQEHLGFLCAWLAPRGTRESRDRAAREAERLAVGTSLDPEIERKELEPHVSRWNELVREGGPAAERKRAETAIRTVLKAEIDRRIDLLEMCLDLVHRDTRKPNSGLDEFHRLTTARLGRDIEWVGHGGEIKDGKKTFVRSPIADSHPQQAAARYLEIEAAQESVACALLRDDTALQRDVFVNGDGIEGRIVEVRDEGSGRSHVPVWVVESDHQGPLRVRKGTTLEVAGCPARRVRVDLVDPRDGGGRRFEVRVTDRIRAFESAPGRRVPDAWDARALTGKTLALLPTTFGLLFRKFEILWRPGKPGDWVHRLGRPQIPTEPGEEEA